MSRKLILTPFHHGAMMSTNNIVNNIILKQHETQFDILDIVLSSVAMAGVDFIYSMVEIKESDTNIIKDVISTNSISKWNNCANKVHTVFANYKRPGLDEEQLKQIEYLSYLIIDLLFGVETNSGLLIGRDLKEYFNTASLPLELLLPAKVLFNSIQTKEATLPVVNLDLSKKDILKLFDIFRSKEFHNYKEAHLQIDQNLKLTNQTIQSIEKASKDLYSKNTRFFRLKENLISAIPVSAKIIDLFFGKLPGILADYAGNILSTNLNSNKTIPLYNYEGVIAQIVNKSLAFYLDKHLPTK